jgi:MFS family permease
MQFKSVLPSRQMAILCLASLCWAFGFGLSAPLASLWLKDAGYSNSVIGWNTGVYYLGIALAAILVPLIMRRLGRLCPVVGIALTGVTIALFPLGGSLFAWFALRLANGVAGALSLIPIETYVNHQSAANERARNFGFYAFSMALGIALGTLVGLQMYRDYPIPAFLLGGMVTLGGSFLVQCGMMWPEFHVAKHDDGPLEFRANFLCFGSGWAQGFLEGGMIALLPIYLLTIGFTEDGASWLMSTTMLGVILIQVPVAWLADRLGRQAVLLGCYAVAVIGLLALPFFRGAMPLGTTLLVVAAGSAAFYPLGLALLGERTQQSGLARANAWFLGINCIGSLVGPVVAGSAMDWFGGGALFYSGEAALIAVLGVSALAQLSRRATLSARPAVEASVVVVNGRAA